MPIGLRWHRISAKIFGWTQCGEIAACLADEDEYHSEYITKNADIELLEWKSTNPTIPHGKDMLPTSSESELQKYRQFPRRLDEDIGEVDPAEHQF